jgi:hypothetical protein
MTNESLNDKITLFQDLLNDKNVLIETLRVKIHELIKEVGSLKKHGAECVVKYSEILKEMEIFITGTGMWFTSHSVHCDYLKTISEIFNLDKNNG